MCVFCHLLEKDHQAWKADWLVCTPGPTVPLCQPGQSTAKLIKCDDALGFRLDHFNLQLELSYRNLPKLLSLRSSGLATLGPGCFESLHHILWPHS